MISPVKRLFLILCFLLLFINCSLAKNKFRLTVGPTISYFLDAENARPKTGIAICISKNFYLNEKVWISAGVGFASRGAILENRTIAPYVSEPTDAFYQDIHGMLGYLEIPVLIQVEIPVSNKVKINPMLGPLFSFPVVDLSHFKKKQFFKVYIPFQSNPLDYDFDFEQESVFNNNITKVGFTFGFQIQYRRYGLELRYLLDNREVYHFDRLSEVGYKMNSMYLLMSYTF